MPHLWEFPGGKVRPLIAANRMVWFRVIAKAFLIEGLAPARPKTRQKEIASVERYKRGEA